MKAWNHKSVFLYFSEMQFWYMHILMRAKVISTFIRRAEMFGKVWLFVFIASKMDRVEIVLDSTPESKQVQEL